MAAIASENGFSWIKFYFQFHPLILGWLRIRLSQYHDLVHEFGGLIRIDSGFIFMFFFNFFLQYWIY
jgi:hypothetical protein